VGAGGGREAMSLYGEREDAVRPALQIAMPRLPRLYAPGVTILERWKKDPGYRFQELGRKALIDYSTDYRRSFFQGYSQSPLASSLAGGWSIQDWKEEKVGKFCIPKTGVECRSKGHQIQVFEPC